MRAELKQAAGYIYNRVQDIIKNLGTDTVLVLDRTSYLANAINTVAGGYPVEWLAVSDIIELYLQDDVESLLQKAKALVRFSVEEYPASRYTLLDIYRLLGLEHLAPTNTVATVVDINSYEALLEKVVRANESTLLEYTAYAVEALKHRIAKLVVAAKDAGFSKAAYLGAYDMDWAKYVDPDSGVVFEKLPVNPADLKLINLALADVRYGTPVFYDEKAHLVHFNTDMLADQNSYQLTDSILNYIAGMHLGVEPVPETLQDAEYYYNLLLPYYENTNYNYLQTALKNAKLDVTRLQETGDNAGEYDDTAVLETEALDNLRVPDHLCEPYKIDELCQPSPAGSQLVVGLPCYGRSFEQIQDRVQLLLDTDAVSGIVLHIPDLEPEQLAALPKSDKIKRICVEKTSNYAESVNKIAQAAIEACPAGYLLIQDCADPVDADTLNKLPEAIALFPRADVLTFDCVCVQDMYVANLPFAGAKELFTTLYARRYLNLSSMLFKLRVFKHVTLDSQLVYNAQYEFLFRLVLAGADFEAVKGLVGYHNYELGSGKHMQDKENYTNYLAYVEAKHSDIVGFAREEQNKYREHIESLKTLQHQSNMA